MTTFPTCFCDSKYAKALVASSNGNTLSTTGLVISGFALIKRFKSLNLGEVSQPKYVSKVQNELGNRADLDSPEIESFPNGLTYEIKF